MADSIRVNVIFPTEIHEVLRKIAFDEHTTIPDIIRKAVDADLAKRAKKANKK